MRQLYGVMAARGATGGFVVTSGQFTADAVAFAKGRNVELVDGPNLSALLKKATDARAKPVRAPNEPASVATSVDSPSAADTHAALEVPACPRCESPMVMRTSKAGANAGSRFWGCATYPRCRGQRTID